MLLDPFRAGTGTITSATFDEPADRSIDIDPDAVTPDGACGDRYVVGQRLYEDESEPATRATFVIDNDDLANPRCVVCHDRGIELASRGEH